MPGARRARAAGAARASAWGGVLVATLFAGAPLAGAGLYRCIVPGGGIRYTDDASACPGAPRYEPRRRVQRFERPAPAPDPLPAARAPSAAPEAGEATWRQKHREARFAFEELTREVASLRRSVGWCNQGRKLLVRDEATGLNRQLSCDAVRAREQARSAELERVRAYLDGGIQEECRRAGCLPGWLR